MLRKLCRRAGLVDRMRVVCYDQNSEKVAFHLGKWCRLCYCESATSAVRFIEVEYSTHDTPTGVLMRLLYQLVCEFPTGQLTSTAGSPVTYLEADCEAVRMAFNPDGKVRGIYWDRHTNFHQKCDKVCKYAARDQAVACWDVSHFMSNDFFYSIKYDWLTCALMGVENPACDSCGDALTVVHPQEYETDGLSAFTFEDVDRKKVEKKVFESIEASIRPVGRGIVLKHLTDVKLVVPAISKSQVMMDKDHFSFAAQDGTFKVERLIEDLPDFAIEDFDNYKGRLQEYVVSKGWMPSYEYVRKGQPHLSTFYVLCKPGNGRAYLGTASDKKTAEMRAARAACTDMISGIAGVSAVDVFVRSKGIVSPRIALYARDSLMFPSVPPPTETIIGAAFVHVHNRTIGLISERPGKPWNLPGGKKEGKETPLETVVRESREEIGGNAIGLRFTQYIVSQHAGASCTLFLCEHDGLINGLRYVDPSKSPPDVAPWILRALMDAQGRPRVEAFMTIVKTFPTVGTPSSSLDGPICSNKKGIAWMFDRNNPEEASRALQHLTQLEQ